MTQRVARGGASDAWALLLVSARPLGLLMSLLAGTMLVTALVGLLLGSVAGAGHMGLSAAITALFGAGALALGRSLDDAQIGRREALLVVTLGWVALGVFGGLPFVIGADFTPVDALFESVSGFTTTGASILPEINQRLNPALHFWRTLTHWIGGLGFVVLFVAVFPALGVGGKRLFQGEVAGPRGKALTPRIRETSLGLWRVYTVLTLVMTGLLWLSGVSLSESMMHAFATMGTGGFSTRNLSIAELGSGAGVNGVAVDVVITVFMLIAGMNFGLFYDATRRGPKVIFKDPEARLYLWIIGVATVLCALAILPQVGHVGQALRYSAFSVVSVITTTGFMNYDFETFPTFGKLVLLPLFFIGGCGGSTSGGIKVIRLIFLMKIVLIEAQRSFRPNLVAPVRVGEGAVPSADLFEAVSVMGLFVATVGAGGALVALFDPVDGTTAMTAALTCVGNVGPGFGAVGPTENFGFFSDASKLVLSACMLLGRLEFLTVLALLAPGFWRR